jgi:hypothetical protein
MLADGIAGRGQRQVQVNTGGTNNVMLVMIELVLLSPNGFIGDRALMSGNQKAEYGRGALEWQIGRKRAQWRKFIEWWRIGSEFD